MCMLVNKHRFIVVVGDHLYMSYVPCYYEQWMFVSKCKLRSTLTHTYWLIYLYIYIWCLYVSLVEHLRPTLCLCLPTNCVCVCYCRVRSGRGFITPKRGTETAYNKMWRSHLWLDREGESGPQVAPCWSHNASLRPHRSPEIHLFPLCSADYPLLSSTEKSDTMCLSTGL
jgi:hypothetical protein